VTARADEFFDFCGGEMKTEWRSRIVGHGEENPDQLLANPANWRIHPKKQQDALAGVLSEIGWVQSVIVNQRTGHLIDGHMRVALALRDDAKQIPVVYVDLSEDEEALVLATLDPLSGLAITDTEKLDELLSGVSTNSADVQALLEQLGAQAISGLADQQNSNTDPGIIAERYEVIIECASEDEQAALLLRLSSEGLKVRAIVI
jgi:hypothetical protein